MDNTTINNELWCI